MGSLDHLMHVHRDLDELFARHRDAIVLLNFKQALELLEQYEVELRRHMKHEEEQIFPLYEERVGHVPGGDPRFFYLEHANLLKNLALFKPLVEKLAADPSAGPRQAHECLREQSSYLHLLEHHDLREKNILYPQLDRKLTQDERSAILSRCGFDHDPQNTQRCV